MKPLKASKLLALLLLCAACTTKYSFVNVPPGFDQAASLPPEGTYVCDPFDAGPKASLQTGIIGSLHYLDASQPQYSSVRDYLQFGHAINDVMLIMNRLYVPTRPFDRGFTTLGGDVLRNESGEALIEWFAVDMRTRLGLGPTDAPGAYQLALITDDGSILTVGDGAGTELINNDGFHSTKMKCATQPLDFQPGSTIPARIEYFQGPRTHISLVLMWRPWPANPADVNDPECDQSGNDHFFDSTQNPSAPRQAYNDLLARGWRPMSAQNFYMPGSILNPCE
ncbi:MAG TPA: hypothetical protein VFV50_18880 [Bdellovibrionales bacterium]|nr:hypothetical protein [Bdellovibrionales bacterium]